MERRRLKSEWFVCCFPVLHFRVDRELCENELKMPTEKKCSHKKTAFFFDSFMWTYVAKIKSLLGLQIMIIFID